MEVGYQKAEIPLLSRTQISEFGEALPHSLLFSKFIFHFVFLIVFYLWKLSQLVSTPVGCHIESTDFKNHPSSVSTWHAGDPQECERKKI